MVPTYENKAMRRFRIIIAAVTVLCVLVCAVYAAGEFYRRRDYREKFHRMHGSLGCVQMVDEGRRSGHHFWSLELSVDSGAYISASLKVPAGEGGRYPALVVLGGLRTGRRTIDYLGSTKGIVILALDYPYEGKKEDLGVIEFLWALPRIRRAVIETVPSVMLWIDYLLTREDVEQDKIMLVGGSLGAMFVPAAMAADERIAAGAILFGAGDIERLARANLRMPAFASAPAAWLCAVLASPVEPLKYVADVSPRPLFMLNGLGDPRIPARCSTTLHETAREPKTIRWIDAGHVNVRSSEFHEQVGRELTQWLVSLEFIEPGLF